MRTIERTGAFKRDFRPVDADEARPDESAPRTRDAFH
jgi:hypothetical protein